jgi:hypothetical protein
MPGVGSASRINGSLTISSLKGLAPQVFLVGHPNVGVILGHKFLRLSALPLIFGLTFLIKLALPLLK